MLPKKQRIPKAQAREVFMRGTTSSSPHFLLKTLPLPGNESLFAVAISKKVASTAVLRNRTRRRVYSVLRDLVPRSKPGFSVAFSVKKGGETITSDAIQKEVESLLSRANLLSR